MNTKASEFVYPAKTFLIGEYAVLRKAPCILVNTQPCFRFKVQFKVPKNHPFDPKSPAGQFIEKNKSVFSDVSIHIFNPHRSGLGLSSAEFNCVYDIYLKKKNLKKNLFHLYQEYSSLSLGSGADVLSQQVGGVCLLKWEPFSVLSIQWPFKNLHFFLIRLQENHSTHKHLEDLKNFNFEKLIKISNQAFSAFQNVQEEKFVRCVQEYDQELSGLGLVHKGSQKKMEFLKKIPNLKAIKGCGALGAEILVVFFEKEKESEVLKHLKSFQIEAGLQSLEERL